MIRAALLATALVVAPAGFLARPASAAPAERSAQDAQLQDLLNQVTAFSAPYQAAMVEAGEVTTVAMEGMNRAIEMINSGATDAGWVDVWEQDVKARSAALRARVPTLPAFPSALLNLSGGEPNLDARMRAYERIGVQGKAVILTTANFVDGVLPLARKVANGDEAAVRPVAAKLLAGSRLMIASENAMLEVGIAAGGPEHPQSAVLRATLAGNDVLELLLTYHENALEDLPNDDAKLAAALRAKAAIIRAEAAAIPVYSKSLDDNLVTISDPATRTRLRTVMKSYDENIVIEVALADGIDSLAAAIDKGENSAEAMDPLLSLMDEASVKRNEIQTRRIALMRP
jgi:hypothetical protein